MKVARRWGDCRSRSFSDHPFRRHSQIQRRHGRAWASLGPHTQLQAAGWGLPLYRSTLLAFGLPAKGGEARPHAWNRLFAGCLNLDAP